MPSGRHLGAAHEHKRTQWRKLTARTRVGWSRSTGGVRHRWVGVNDVTHVAECGAGLVGGQVLVDSESDAESDSGRQQIEERRQEERADAVVGELEVLARGVTAIHQRLRRTSVAAVAAAASDERRAEEERGEALMDQRGRLLARMQSILDTMHLKPRRIRSFTA
jgi:hypothetical protein